MLAIAGFGFGIVAIPAILLSVYAAVTYSPQKDPWGVGALVAKGALVYGLPMAVGTGLIGMLIGSVMYRKP